MILITGGLGFIGYHLVKNLLNENNNIIVIDDLSSGSLNNIIENKNIIYINENINNINVNNFNNIKAIYNLACPASPIVYKNNPIHTTLTCVQGMYNILEIARLNNCKLLQASTSEVYGDPLIHPQKENYYGNVNPIGERSCYDEGKRCAESLCFDYIRKYNLDVKIARIFNTYGPNMRKDDGRVIPNFINQAINNEPITINNDGFQTRSFTYIDDTVKGLELLMKSYIKGPVNIGNDEEITVYSLAKLILKLTKSKSDIIYLDKSENDPLLRRPDILLANSIGWSPSVSLKKGIKKTIDYYT